MELGEARIVIVRVRVSSSVRVIPVSSRTTRNTSVISSGVLEEGSKIVRWIEAS